MKPREYAETTFYALGEDEHDAEAILYEFYANFTEKKKYGDFEITDDLISIVNQASRQLESTLCDMLANNSAKYTMQDFASTVKSILSTYR